MAWDCDYDEIYCRMYLASVVEAEYNSDGRTADGSSIVFDDSLGFNEEFRREIFKIKTKEVSQTSYCELPLRALCYHKNDDLDDLYTRLVYSMRIYVTVTGED